AVGHGLSRANPLGRAGVRGRAAKEGPAHMILLARHGETDDNREPIRIQGTTDTPLNDTGRAQAADLAQRVADRGIAWLYTSHLSRAREAAEIVGGPPG